MRVRFCVFGCEVFAFEIVKDDVSDEYIAQLLASVNATEAVSESDTDGDKPTSKMGGGYIQNFERDVEPRFPEDRFGDHYIERPFGFVPLL
jgi:hypothetical protein